MWRAVAVALVLLAGCTNGYLSHGEYDVRSVLPPAPKPGDARAEADRAVFRGTRGLLVGPRGALAKADVSQSPAKLLADFSCSVGVTLTPANAPAVLRLLRHASADTGWQTNRAKSHFHHKRPFQIDRGRTCESKFLLGFTYDYPSGHATHGSTWALLLAELAPDRAEQILARGRAYRESRVVCGVHNASAVEAGEVSARATIAAMKAKPRFVAEFAAARAEMDRIRSDPGAARPDAGMCEAEAALIAQPVVGGATTSR